MSLRSVIQSRPLLKKFLHRLIVKSSHPAPRLWVKWLVNPFVHKRGRASKICWYARMDVFPFRNFELGRHTIVEDFTVINNGVGDVIIGNNTGVGLSNIIIGPVTIGNYVMLAQHIVLSGLNHAYEDISMPPRIQKVVTSPIIIEDEVWIGANSVITAGVTVGKHAIIGAGSVVTKNVPPYTVVVGNPARIVKKYNFETGNWEKV